MIAPDFADVRYADRSARNCLDLYVPDGGGTPPLVVWIHGGAFRFGDKRGRDERGPDGLAALLAAGFAVASINYRFSSEAQWPAQLDDLTDAFAWLRANAATYGYDPARVAAFGPSAGGYYSAMAGIVLAGDPATRLRASVVWYPPVEFSRMDADLALTGVTPAAPPNAEAGSPESDLIGAVVADNPDLAHAASPLFYLDKLPADTPLPAFLIMHGDRDPLIGRGQSGRLFSGLLARNGVAALEYVMLAGGAHGGPAFDDPATVARVVAFLKTAMRDG